MPTSSLQRGFAPLKRLPRGVWQPMRALATAFVTPVRFALATGHFKSSLQSKACSKTGEPLPWYTYAAIDFLSVRDYAGMRILEFGGGQSTLWWSARAESILTIDPDADWAKYVAKNSGDNVTVHHVPVDRDTRSIDPIREIIKDNGIDKFDVIIIDGHLREELVVVAFDHLAPNGAVIMDNAEGYRFVELLEGRDCRRFDFYGFAPGSSMRSCTSIAYEQDCFLIQPGIPINTLEELR